MTTQNKVASMLAFADAIQSMYPRDRTMARISRKVRRAAHRIMMGGR